MARGLTREGGLLHYWFSLADEYIQHPCLPSPALLPLRFPASWTAIFAEAVAETALESVMIVGFVGIMARLTKEFVAPKYIEVARLAMWTAVVFLSGAATAGPKRYLETSQLFNIENPISEDWWGWDRHGSEWMVYQRAPFFLDFICCYNSIVLFFQKADAKTNAQKNIYRLHVSNTIVLCKSYLVLP